MARVRDMQRAKLYRAEALSTLRTGDFLDLEACADLVQRAHQWGWTQVKGGARFGWVGYTTSRGPIRVGDGRGRRSAVAFLNEVRLPRWGRRPVVILHEVAHLFNPAAPNGIATMYRPEAAHGREFAARFLDLVRHFMGVAVAGALRASFRQHQVRYTAKRTLTPEALARLRAQGQALAAARRTLIMPAGQKETPCP